jgi:serine/threonine protein phosphatase PrpC
MQLPKNIFLLLIVLGITSGITKQHCLFGAATNPSITEKMEFEDSEQKYAYRERKIELGTCYEYKSSDQDRHAIDIIKLGDSQCAFAGVYDGHGYSAHVAEALATNLHPYIYERIAKGMTIEDALNESVALLDHDIKSISGCGSTAVFGLVFKNHLYIANVGDSRAVLCNHDGKVVFETKDHKPDSPTEIMRARSAGGMVWLNGIIFKSERYLIFKSPYEIPGFDTGDFNEVFPEGVTSYEALDKYYQRKYKKPLKIQAYTSRQEVWRLGSFAMTRSVGDYNQSSYKHPGLICNPEITKIPLSDQHYFVIFASDGVWDVISSQDACTVVHENLIKFGSAGKAAKQLVDVATLMGADDDATAVIMLF